MSATLPAWIVAARISGVTGIVTAVGESHAFVNFLSEVSDVVGFSGEFDHSRRCANRGARCAPLGWSLGHFRCGFVPVTLRFAKRTVTPHTSLPGHHPSAPRHNFTGA
jgi:hypothetical protein